PDARGISPAIRPAARYRHLFVRLARLGRDPPGPGHWGVGYQSLANRVLPAAKRTLTAADFVRPGRGDVHRDPGRRLRSRHAAVPNVPHARVLARDLRLGPLRDPRHGPAPARDRFRCAVDSSAWGCRREQNSAARMHWNPAGALPVRKLPARICRAPAFLLPGALHRAHRLPRAFPQARLRWALLPEPPARATAHPR